MKKKMRVMTEQPRNAETPVEGLRSWITANDLFFDRNQGQIPEAPMALDQWQLEVTGEVKKPLIFSFDEILQMPKDIIANTLECSGNGRSLLTEKASGNPWTIGGVGNAVYGGTLLRNVFDQTRLLDSAHHVAFEGFDESMGRAKIKFIRSIPLEKALDSTLLAYEMNGEPLPLKHGYPLRALALGWTGANCVKWLKKITVLEKPAQGFFMDRVYRIFQKGEDRQKGAIATTIPLKSIITHPLSSVEYAPGRINILGAAYGGERRVEKVEVSTDNGHSWHLANFIGPDEPYAWRQWQYIWEVKQKGDYTIMARAFDTDGNSQPMNAKWNVLGYMNNGIHEHRVSVVIR